MEASARPAPDASAGARAIPAPVPAPVPTPEGFLGRLWARCARHPALALVLAVALHTLPVLGARDLWIGDEVRHGSALRGVVEHGQIWVLEMSGRPYPDKPPLWFMGVGAIAWLTGSTDPWVFFLAAALSAWLLARATYGMARHVAGLAPEAALLPALAASATPLVLMLARTTRMDLLFAAFICAAFTALFRGLFTPAGGRHTLAGFAWGALACWTKGPLGLVLPLATALTALAWRGRLRRLLARDVLGGLVLGLAIVGAWAGSVVLARGPEFLSQVLGREVAGRFLDASHHREPVWFYLAMLPLMLVPWSLLPVALPWRPSSWPRRIGPALAARRAGDDGRLWLVAIVVSGLGVLSSSSMKFFIYLAPLLPPLLILSTSALAAANPAARARFAVWAAAVGLLTALALPLAALHPESPLAPTALLPASAALGLAAWLLFTARRGPASSVTLASTLGLALVALVGTATIAPRLDALASPRALAERLTQLTRAGAQPMTYGIYSGTFAYHAAVPIAEAHDLDDVARHVAGASRPLVVVSARRAERVRERIPGLVVLEQHASLEGPFMILARADDPGSAPR